MRRWLQPLLSALLILLTASVVSAQYAQDFDGLVGDPNGNVPLTDQDFFYNPAGVDFHVYTYAGNNLSVIQNPEGGTQFAGGVAVGDGVTFARAQRDAAWGDGTGCWTHTYDFCAVNNEPAPVSNNIASFSFRYDDLNVYNIHLMSWVNLDDPAAGYNAWYLAYDASGVQFAQPGSSPGPAWDGLQLNHWYRFWMTFDLNTNLITEVGIIDLHTMAQSVYNPTDWYLVGGAGGHAGPPTSFRLFGGGTVYGNVAGFDNVLIEACGAVTGACCIGQECFMYTQTECDAAGGDFVGGECTPQTCVVPTEVTTWGQIKNAYR
jgi:hypothetical protein